MRFIRLTLVIILGIVSLGQTAYANPTSGSVTVSPAILQLSLSKGQSSLDFSTQIFNNTNHTINVSLSAKDFTSVGQGGAVGFIHTSTGDATSHGLAQSIHFALNNLVISSNSSETVPVTIDSQDLAVGGHYAAVIYHINSSTPSRGNNVKIEQSLSSLIFLSTSGEGSQNLKLTTPILSTLETSFPQNINLVLSNSGNTQTTPQGLVQIFGPNNKLIEQANLNINSSLILPGSNRLFNLTLMKMGSLKLASGEYHLKVIYGYDGQNHLDVYESNFVYVNLDIVVWAIVIIVCLAYAYKKIHWKPFAVRIKNNPLKFKRPKSGIQQKTTTSIAKKIAVKGSQDKPPKVIKITMKTD